MPPTPPTGSPAHALLSGWRAPAPAVAGRAALLALGGVVAGVLGFVGLLTAPGRGQVVAVATVVLVIGVGPALTTLAVVVLVRGVELLTPRRALHSAVAATVAWTLAVLSSLSWSQGFDQADAGLPTTTFADAFVPLLLAAFAAGTVALLPVTWPPLGRIGNVVLRAVLAGVTALGAVVAIGVLMAAPVSVIVVALVVLVASVRWWRRGPR